MVRHAKAKKSKAQPKLSRPSAKLRLDELIKFKLQRHTKWPYLKVSDWQLLAREHWRLNEKIKLTDPRYRMIHAFAKTKRCVRGNML